MTYAPIKIEFAETFKRKNGIHPGPQLGIYHDELWWYFVVYAQYKGDYKNHIFRWKPGVKAEHVSVAAETVARGDIGVHGEGSAGGAAEFSWDDNGEYPNLWVQEVPDFVPAPLDARVDLLVEEVAQLRAEVAALSQGSGLSAEDRASLDWTAQVRALE